MHVISNPVMCPMSFNLENGDHKLIMEDGKVEYQMEMTCDKGYKMVGVKIFTCKNGLWSRVPSATRCVGMYLTTSMYIDVIIVII